MFNIFRRDKHIDVVVNGDIVKFKVIIINGERYAQCNVKHYTPPYCDGLFKEYYGYLVPVDDDLELCKDKRKLNIVNREIEQ